VLGRTACAVGNSSSFVRDAGYFGTPVVLVGDRQDGRETDVHAVRCAPRAEEIVGRIRGHLANGRYAPSTLYGDGHVAPRVAEALASLKPYVQKRLYFVQEEAAQKENDHAGTWNRDGARGFKGNPGEEHYAVAGQAAAGVDG
jgi:hypothetical protein